ncbi:hypothetical protein BS47DRAFT_649683 [Hydnum rufescens UP504]|uniref:Uncharacterized protein n=1 Tax=Hydnum rufescens UP504 TaxID=1448309 RepID=A0A9P6E2P5_9AGAM|nr:hypothetical protein BS47DRAFT_649683 [Hydnum rufescens UP504]
MHARWHPKYPTPSVNIRPSPTRVLTRLPATQPIDRRRLKQRRRQAHDTVLLLLEDFPCCDEAVLRLDASIHHGSTSTHFASARFPLRMAPTSPKHLILQPHHQLFHGQNCMNNLKEGYDSPSRIPSHGFGCALTGIGDLARCLPEKSPSGLVRIALAPSSHTG